VCWLSAAAAVLGEMLHSVWVVAAAAVFLMP
jgi:hypothetical protein